jgi:hypothetical protein
VPFVKGIQNAAKSLNKKKIEVVRRIEIWPLAL